MVGFGVVNVRKSKKVAKRNARVGSVRVGVRGMDGINSDPLSFYLSISLSVYCQGVPRAVLFPVLLDENDTIGTVKRKILQAAGWQDAKDSSMFSLFK